MSDKNDWRSRKHKEIALEKLNSAVILYRNCGYLTSFYIVGYVFEMGMQYELKQLGEKTLTESQKIQIVETLGSNAISLYLETKSLNHDYVQALWSELKSIKDKIRQQNNEQTEQNNEQTENDTYKFVLSIVDNSNSNSNSTKKSKQLTTLIKDTHLFWALVKGRLNQQAAGVDGHHDTGKLFDTVKQWYVLTGVSKSDQKYVEVDQIHNNFEKLNWYVELRYQYTENREQYLQRAKEAIDLAERFLTKVLGCTFNKRNSISYTRNQNAHH